MKISTDEDCTIGIGGCNLVFRIRVATEIGHLEKPHRNAVFKYLENKGINFEIVEEEKETFENGE